jgi:CHASE2 domain-containing sensor protein
VCVRTGVDSRLTVFALRVSGGVPVRTTWRASPLELAALVVVVVVCGLLLVAFIAIVLFGWIPLPAPTFD